MLVELHWYMPWYPTGDPAFPEHSPFSIAPDQVADVSVLPPYAYTFVNGGSGSHPEGTNITMKNGNKFEAKEKYTEVMKLLRGE